MKKFLVNATVLLFLSYPVISMAGVCEIANSTTSKIATALTISGATTGVGLKVIGVSAVAHSSGATILTASGSYLAGTLGFLGTIGSVATAPVTLVVGGLTIVSVGSAALYCSYVD